MTYKCTTVITVDSAFDKRIVQQIIKQNRKKVER